MSYLHTKQLHYQHYQNYGYSTPFKNGVNTLNNKSSFEYEFAISL